MTSPAGNSDQRQAGARRGRRLVLPAILLALAEGDAHGYTLAHDLAAQGFLERPDTAIVYRTLAELETRGLVVATEDEGARGPRRKVYALTVAGRRELEEWAGLIATRVLTLQRFLQRYRALD